MTEGGLFIWERDADAVLDSTMRPPALFRRIAIIPHVPFPPLSVIPAKAGMWIHISGATRGK